MTIRQQICWSVIPLFVLVGFTANAFSAWREIVEIDRGFERQGRATAVSLAENFHAWTDPGTDDRFNRISEAMVNLQGFAELQEVAFWQTGEAPDWTWPRGFAAQRILTPDRDGQPVTSDLEFDADEVASLTAGASTTNADGSSFGWLEVRLEDASLSPLHHEAIVSAVVRGGVVILIGIGLALGLAFVFRRDISRLEASTPLVGHDAFKITTDLHIREFGELADVFHVLDSLIQESGSKSQSRMLDGGTVEMEETDLVDAFKRQWLQPIDQCLVAGRKVSVRHLKTGEASAWFAVAEREGTGMVVCGNLQASATLETARKAHAVARAFEQKFEQPSVGAAEIIAELSNDYPLANVMALQWHENDSVGIRIRWSSGQSPQSETWQGSRTVGHNQSGGISELIELLVHHADSASNHELFELLESAASQSEATLALIGEKSPS